MGKRDGKVVSRVLGDGDGINVGSLPRRPLLGDTVGEVVGLSSEVSVGV